MMNFELGECAHSGCAIHHSKFNIQNFQAARFLHSHCGTSYEKHPFRFLRRSEEHTSELQSQSNLVCRLLLENKNGEKLKSSDFSVNQRNCGVSKRESDQQSLDINRPMHSDAYQISLMLGLPNWHRHEPRITD